MSAEMLNVFTAECAAALSLLAQGDGTELPAGKLDELSGAALLCGMENVAGVINKLAEQFNTLLQPPERLELLQRLQQTLEKLQSLTPELLDNPDDSFWSDLYIPALDTQTEKQPDLQMESQQKTEPKQVSEKKDDSPKEQKPAKPAIVQAVPIDEGMRQMFLTEVRERLQTLSDGVLTLEQGSDPSGTLEELMRAAHSLKGAARIINLQPASELAHALEDKFVALQKAPAQTSSAQTDILLQTIDGLEKLCLQQQDDPVQYLALLSGFDAASGATKSAPAIQHDSTESGTVQAIPASASVKEENSSGENSRFLRLSAHSVSRIMALSGEGVVSARRLEPLGGNLRELQIRHTRILEFYDYLYQQAMQGNIDGSLFSDLRRQLEECQNLLRNQSQLFDRVSGDFNELSERLYREALSSRMRPFSEGVQGLQRMVRDLSRELDKPVDFQILGLQTRVDRDILARLEAPLGHLVRNSMDHGLQTAAERQESGKSQKNKLTLQALHWAGFLNVILSDDGRGIDLDGVRKKIIDKKLHSKEEADALSDDEVIEFLFLPGFSTRLDVTEISGRGVGLDVVRSTLQEIGGSVTVDNRPGEGVSFRMQLPVTRSVVRVLLVELGGEVYAIALSRIERLLRVQPQEISSLEGQRYITSDGQNISISDAAPMLDHAPSKPDGKGRVTIVVVRHNQQLYGLQVGAFLGEKELAQRPLDPRLGKVSNIEAVLPMEDGKLALSLDVDDLISMARKSATPADATGNIATSSDTEKQTAVASKKILVIDDSPTVREMEKRMLQDSDFEVDTACDGVEGWLRARAGNYRMVISDIDMPRMNGLQLLHALRNAQRFDDMPIMLVSYKDDEQTEAQAHSSGVDYYINKGSFNTGEFVQVVQQLYNGGRGAATARQKRKH